MPFNHIHIFDLDGTVIDSSHRYKTVICDDGIRRIDLPHWIENEDKIHVDGFLPLIDHVRELIARPDKYVIFATARACIKGDDNYQFLKNHDIIPNKFIHRQGRKDNRGGAELKIQAIKPLLNLKQFKNVPLTVYEDNKSYLLKMCTALGAIPYYNLSIQGL